MAFDIFLKLDGYKGESVDKTHKDEIDVLAWSWGLTQSGTMHTSTGGGAGKVSVQDISITKYVDSVTPNLVQLVCSGKHIKEAILTVRKAGGTPIEYLVIKMTDVIITSVGEGGSGGEERLTEHLALNFSKYEINYTPQKADGTPGSKITKTWNIATNSES